MKTHIYLLSILFLASFAQLSIAEDQTITLKDGSQIRGELVGVGGGVYTVHSSTLGDIKVSSSNVASISNGAPQAQAMQQAPLTNSFAPQPPVEDFNQKIQSAQNKLMNDPGMMQQLSAMAQDPELMKMLSDPELVRAVTNHDVKAIEANPKAQALMNNPKMRSIMEQMKGSGNY